MALTNRYYGGSSFGAGRTIQDFGLCDLSGNYVYTAKTRAKGLLVVSFFSPDSEASTNVLNAISQWTEEIALAKWTALAVAGPNKEAVAAYAKAKDCKGASILVDYDLYQTRAWGISHLPSTFLIDGKTGAVLHKAIGGDASELLTVKELLASGVAKLVAAEEAAKKAEEEKKAAEAAAKAAAEPVKA